MSRPTLQIRRDPLSGPELDAMAAVAARAFRDDPLAVAVFARTARAREERMRSVYEGMLRTLPHPPVSAWLGARAVGLAGLAPPRSGAVPLARLLPALPRLIRGARPAELRPALAWLRAVAGAAGNRDDWHLGPVVVDPDRHGGGAGTRMLELACAGFDAAGEGAALSTDVEANLGFYARFGFEQVDTGEVLGRSVWYLRRLPSRPSC